MFPTRMRMGASVLRLVQLLVLLLAVQLDAFALNPAGRVHGGGHPSNQPASLNGRGKPPAGGSWRAAQPAISAELRSKVPLTVQTMSGGGEGGQVRLHAYQNVMIAAPHFGDAGRYVPGRDTSQSVHTAVYNPCLSPHTSRTFVLRPEDPLVYFSALALPPASWQQVVSACSWIMMARAPAVPPRCFGRGCQACDTVTGVR